MSMASEELDQIRTTDNISADPKNLGNTGPVA